MQLFFECYCDRLILMFDQDEAGKYAANQVQKKATNYRVDTISFPAKDPSDLYMTRGLQESASIIKSRAQHLSIG